MFRLLKKENLISFGVLVPLGCLLSVCFRYELLWDFLHYHYYNGFAFVYDRLGYDIAPAALNTYFNPLLDTLTFLAVNAFNDMPDVYYALTGLPFGLLLFVCFKINRLFIKNTALALLALIIGATGFATFFQIGTSTNEIPVALIVMTALYFMIKALFVQFSLYGFLGAAFLLGAAAALKSTAAVYCVSSGIAVIAFYKNIDKPFKNISLFTLCGLAGFLFFNGFWMFKLYSLFQNPFFPFMNKIFKSPFFDDVNYSFRVIFADRSFWDAVFLPFSFITHFQTSYTANNAFTDIRFAAAFVLLFCAMPFYRSLMKDKPFAFLIVWCLVSYLLWLYLFSVIRYLVPVEMMLPVFFIKAALKIKPEKPHILKEAVTYSAFIIFVGACLTTPLLSQPWGKRKNWNNVLPELPVRLPENAVIGTINTPNAAYIASLLTKTPSSKIVGVFRSAENDVNPWYFTKTSRMRQIADEELEKNKENLIYFITSPEIMQARPKNTVCRQTRGIYAPHLDFPTTSYEEFSKRYKKTPFFLSVCVPQSLEKTVFSAPFGYYLGKNTPVFDDAL